MSPQLELLEPRIAGGYLPGLSQPAILATLRVQRSLVVSRVLHRLEGQLAQWLPGFSLSLPDNPQGPDAVLTLLQRVLECLQERVNMPRFAPGRQLIQSEDGEGWRCLLILPVLGTSHNAPLHALAWLQRMLERGSGGFSDEDHKALEAVEEHFRREAPTGVMSARFLQVAHEDGIPWRHVTENVYQYGWGCRARLLDSTFTDRTPNIGVRLARSKMATAALLRAAGIPVPRHLPTDSVEQAEATARQLGYPVVVKPNDEDGGRGVFAGLRTPESLRRAWFQARRHSPRLLVEQHISGQDYRVYVFEGEVIEVMLRIPGSVVGDGERSIKALLDETNADPRRHQHGRLQPIALDEEALDLLQEQGMDPNAVPPAGQRVVLRRTANVHTGGEPVVVPLEQVHPDNIELCVRAVRLLRLDLAGVDLLIDDISLSWREGRAGICEVNAQPQMRPALPRPILAQLTRGKGRIPVVLIVESASASWPAEVVAELESGGRRAGLATAAGEVRLDNHCLASAVPDSAVAATLLLGDPHTELVLFHIATLNQLRSGLPVDRCDLLILAGDESFAPEADKLLQLLLPASARVWRIDDARHWRRNAPGMPPVQEVARQGVAAALLQFLESNA